MDTADTFSQYHPVVTAVYFVEVLAFGMVWMHPMALGISLVGALCYHTLLRRCGALQGGLGYLAPTLLMAAVLNVLFNHRGETALWYFPNGNALTLESLAYGAAAAVMLCAMVTWFACFSAVLRADKLVYLLGRAIPAMSLVLSMTLRFVPRFVAQFRAVAEAQHCLGRSIRSGKLLERLHTAVTVFSIVITWSLESAVGTAMSMKSRGYGLPGRTSFALYRWEGRDTVCLLWLVGLGAALLCAAAGGAVEWQYYPVLRGGVPTAWVWLGHLALCLTPVLAEWVDRAAWHRARAR